MNLSWAPLGPRESLQSPDHRRLEELPVQAGLTRGLLWNVELGHEETRVAHWRVWRNTGSSYGLGYKKIGLWGTKGVKRCGID